MIQINDEDFPITSADKIIHGTKTVKASLLDKVVYNAMVGNECNDYVEKDMFDDDELLEIAYHILAYLRETPVVWTKYGPYFGAKMTSSQKEEESC